jgi:hypothetical protein
VVSKLHKALLNIRLVVVSFLGKFLREGHKLTQEEEDELMCMW